MSEEKWMESEINGIFTCDVCEEYKGTKMQVQGHRPHCLKLQQEKTEVPAPRKERIPFGAPQRKWNTPEDDGFHYHVFNDNWSKEPDRIQRAERAGYVKVEDVESTTVGTNEDKSPIKGILMRIPEDIFEEDQKLKQKEVDRVDQAIKSGTLEQQPGDKRYIPDGIKIWSSHDENR